ncbi:MAG: citrate lyase holo-[acyl-carrier protein] synthase [Oscillospiraceae bacterium]
MGQLAGRGISCLHRERYGPATGNEGFYVVSGDAAALKQLTVEMEEHCEIGRLLDLDVLDPRGEKMERQSLGLMPRRCLICGGPAWACARSRSHSVQELRQKTETMLRQAFARQDAQTVAGLACRSLAVRGLRDAEAGAGGPEKQRQPPGYGHLYLSEQHVCPVSLL